jgi:uncharacterized membrane protein
MVEESSTADDLPFAAPCRALSPRAPFRWVREGAADLRRAPRQSLAYGAPIALASVAIVAIAWRYGTYWSVLILLSGFVFVAPLLAIGLYSLSRQLELGERPSLARAIADARRVFATTMVFSLGLLVVFLVWARAGSMLHVFYPDEGDAGWRQFVTFFGIGSAIGAIFAAITFAFSAFALPMITDRQCDAVTAVVTSVNAVLRNKRAMLVWGACIVAAVVVGFALGIVGLGITIPLIGHATWHAYEDTIDAGAWPRHPRADS